MPASFFLHLALPARLPLRIVRKDPPRIKNVPSITVRKELRLKLTGLESILGQSWTGWNTSDTVPSS